MEVKLCIILFAENFLPPADSTIHGFDQYSSFHTLALPRRDGVKPRVNLVPRQIIKTSDITDPSTIFPWNPPTGDLRSYARPFLC